MKVELIAYTPNPEQAIMTAISVCQDSTPNEKDIQMCYRQHHDSVFEFATFHFLVSECSRSFSHQMVRKRIASYMQESQRYVDASNFNYVIPETIQKQSDACDEYNKLMLQIRNTYDRLVDKYDIPMEDARYVLPNATHTKIHIQMNFRSLMEFCSERMCSKSQWEIRDIATEMKRLVTEISPMLGDYLNPKCVRQGKCFERKSCKRLR